MSAQKQGNKKGSGSRKGNGEKKEYGAKSTHAGWKVAVVGEAIIIVLLLLWSPGGMLGGSSCSTGCCATIAGGVDADFGVEVDGDINESYYVGNLDVEYLAIPLALYNLLVAQDFATYEEFIVYMDIHFPDSAYAVYFVYAYIEFEDARAMMDSDYDNISIDGENFSACITGVAIVPFVYFEVFYENGTTYDWFDFALLTQEEIDELTDLEDPVELITQAPDRIIVICGEILTFSIIKVVWDTDEDPYVVVDVDGDIIESPYVDIFPF
jgi:hypothetical protein